MKRRRSKDQIRAYLLFALEEEFFKRGGGANRIVADLIEEEWSRDLSRDRSELSLEIRSLIAEGLGCPVARVRETGYVRDLNERWKVSD